MSPAFSPAERWPLPARLAAAVVYLGGAAWGLVWSWYHIVIGLYGVPYSHWYGGIFLESWLLLGFGLGWCVRPRRWQAALLLPLNLLPLGFFSVVAARNAWDPGLALGLLAYLLGTLVACVGTRKAGRPARPAMV